MVNVGEHLPDIEHLKIIITHLKAHGIYTKKVTRKRDGC